MRNNPAQPETGLLQPRVLSLSLSAGSHSHTYPEIRLAFHGQFSQSLSLQQPLQGAGAGLPGVGAGTVTQHSAGYVPSALLLSLQLPLSPHSERWVQPRESGWASHAGGRGHLGADWQVVGLGFPVSSGIHSYLVPSAENQFPLPPCTGHTRSLSPLKELTLPPGPPLTVPL